MKKTESKIRKLWYGAAYYPEVWYFSDKVIEQDIRYMKEGGFNLMRMAEFAWSTMEPRDGQFEFDQFYETVDKLYKNGIYTIMCTPSCTPPSWLTLHYEETLALGGDGRRLQHGARRHGCSNSPILRRYIARICAEMAHKFAKHPGVVGWQLDNEIHPQGRNGCACPICMEKFRRRLEAKFGTIEELNRAWSMRLWSMEYISFDDVQHPAARTFSHPSLVKEWIDFQSDSNAEFLSVQADVLRANGVDTPIGTDMMPTGGQSYPETNKNLDIVMFNHYNDAKNLWETCFWYDYIRNVIPGVPFWTTETSVSYGGWHCVLDMLLPNGINLVNTLLTYAMGGEANCYWQWRAHPSGQELINGGVITSQGRPQYIFDDCREIAEYLKKTEKFLLGTTVKNIGFAMTFSCSMWNFFEGQPIAMGFNYHQSMIELAYGPLFRAGLRPDIIAEEADLSAYKAIYSPFMPTIDEYGFSERLTKWIEDGGIWIAGPLTDIRDVNGGKYKENPTGHIEDLSASYLAYSMPATTIPIDISWKFGDYEAREKAVVWADGYKIETEKCLELGVYTDSPLQGLSSAFFAPIGAKGGGVIVLGTHPSEKTLTEIVKYVFKSKNIKPGPETSANVVAVERVDETGADAGLVIFETNNSDGFAVLPYHMKNIMTGESLSGRIDLQAYAAIFLEH